MIIHNYYIKPLIVLSILTMIIFGCSDRRDNPTLPDSHPESWLDNNSADFHGKGVIANGIEGCIKCHGEDLIGGKVNVSCIECHSQTAGICTACHGGYNSTNPAPPYGLRGEINSTTIAVGAHTAHLDSMGFARIVECNDCHKIPAFSFDNGHFDNQSISQSDSIAEITWSELADGGNAIWNRNDSTCSGTYCHGSFTGGDTTNHPVWTGSDQASCGSCHDIGGNPARLGWKHLYHVSEAGLSCSNCHSTVIDSLSYIIEPSLHVDGLVEFKILDTAVCNECHGEGFTACTLCHGGTDNETGAPPEGLDGETSISEMAVGAHTAHLTNGQYADAFECNECHIVPTSLFDSGHLGSDSIAEITWGNLAGTQAEWNRLDTTCVNIYCHGNFTGGSTSNNPKWTGTNQAECGSCHDYGLHPGTLSGRHRKHIVDEGVNCHTCHSTVISSIGLIIGLGYHVDGIKTVNLTVPGTFSNGNCSGLPGQCHGTENWYND